YASAFNKAIASSPEATTISKNAQNALTQSFGSAADLATQAPAQYQQQIIAAARQSFLDGANWAYFAGMVAVIVGAAVVFFLFPKHDRELALLARYHEQDQGSETPE